MKKKIILLFGSLFLTISFARQNSASRNMIPSGRPHQIALTFDDGPHLFYTPKLLEILRKENVPATFFLVGIQIKNHPELTRQIIQAGHEVAIHTYNHRPLPELTNTEIVLELERTRLLLKETANYSTHLFRPPGGRYNWRVLDVSRMFNYTMILWDVFPKDHEEPNPEIIIRRVLSQAKDNSVILLHSGRPATIQALTPIIEKLRQRGYTFVTISQILNNPKNNYLVWAFPREKT